MCIRDRYCNQLPLGQLSLLRSARYETCIGQSVMMLCGWQVGLHYRQVYRLGYGSFHVYVTGKTMLQHAIPEHLRDDYDTVMLIRVLVFVCVNPLIQSLKSPWYCTIGAVDRWNTVGLHFKEWTQNVMHDDDCTMLCVADIDVAGSVVIKGYCVSPCRL